MKKLMVSFGYHAEYVIEVDDAVRILEIASRAIRVTREGYSGPYFPAEEQEPFIERAELVDYEPTEEQQPDSGVHLRAANDATSTGDK